MMFLVLFACSRVAPGDVARDASVEPIGNAPVRETTGRDWLYQSGVVHDFFLEFPAESRWNLATNPSVDVPATFTYADRAYTVGVHLRGNRTFRTFDGKPSLKIDFGEYVPGQTFSGARRLTLNNMVQDGSMLREAAAYYLFRAAGISAPRHGYARVWIDGEWYGLYGIVETIDEQFLGDHFASNDGNAYGGGYGADVVPGCAALFTLEEPGDGSIAPYSDLDDLINVVTNDDDFIDVLDVHFDGMLTRYFAVEMVSGQHDGYVTYANNYVLYHDPSVERWSIVPWGTDQSFTARSRDVFKDWFGALALRCLGDADCVERFTGDVYDVLAVWEDSGLYAHIVEVQGAIADDCESDPRRELPCASEQEDVLEYLKERPDDVRSAF